MPGLGSTECHIPCLLWIYSEEVITFALNLSHVRKYYFLPSLNVILKKETKEKYMKQKKSTAVRKEGKLLSIVDNIIINKYIDKQSRNCVCRFIQTPRNSILALSRYSIHRQVRHKQLNKCFTLYLISPRRGEEGSHHICPISLRMDRMK